MKYYDDHFTDEKTKAYSYENIFNGYLQSIYHKQLLIEGKEEREKKKCFSQTILLF